MQFSIRMLLLVIAAIAIALAALMNWLSALLAGALCAAVRRLQSKGT